MSPGHGLPGEVPTGRGRRPGLLPALGAQRVRRTQLHPTLHVQGHPQPTVNPRLLRTNTQGGLFLLCIMGYQWVNLLCAKAFIHNV